LIYSSNSLERGA